jgi:hypothetical protein
MLGLTNRRLVAPSVSTDLVAVELVLPLFVVIVGLSVEVSGNNENPEMLRRQ